ncbi:MAG: protein translocase subunit SecD [Erysipelotrichaceae bacterium]|nr:protein translocase subunit SecD [Erysipelotrichaceae bacterium]
MNTKNKKLTLFFVIVAIIFTVVFSTYKNISNNLSLGIDLKGGFEILYEVTPLNEGNNVDMSAVANSVRKRVDILGVSEPQIIIEGDNRVRVQLAGVSDPDSARSLLGSTSNLTFRDINDELLSDASIISEGGASLSYDNNGSPIVSLKIKDGTKFGEITEKISKMPSGQNILIIWLDFEEGDSYQEEMSKIALGQEPKYVSAATVNFKIDGDAIISGSFTETEARNLAGLINSGSLPVKMTEISSNVVSANYGVDALNKTAIAGLIGILLVFLFMIVIYKLPGVVASIMLVVYIYAIFFTYSSIGAVFTLPGIAALVLGVGMTVDANIITFERIKDELYRGRGIKLAVKEGQNMSFSTIFDAQFTTLLAGLIMYVFGNGAVKGFATMLMITVIATLVINVAVSRFLMNLLVDSGVLDNKYKWFGVKENQIPDISKGEEQFYFGPVKKLDYISIGKKTFIISIAILSLGVILALFNGISNKGPVNLGIDFSSGTKLTISSTEVIDLNNVEDIMNDLGYDSGFSYQTSGNNTVYAVTKEPLSTEELTVIKSAFSSEYGIEPGDNVVTPTVGRDLIKNAVYLSVLAWIAMMIYITIRFKWDYALSCIIALIHDVFIVLAIFVIFRLEVNIELISVILAIIGYSINNSIVVFDRIRELLKSYRGNLNPKAYKQIINDANDNTIVRSVNSSITTIIPVIILLAIGSKAIFTFTFAMFIGLIAGTYFSIFIAPYIWYIIRIKTKPKSKSKKKYKKEKLDEYTIKGINA